MRHSTRNLLLVACLLFVFVPSLEAAGATKEAAEYHTVVKLIESYYHVKHRGVPMLANLSLKTAKVLRNAHATQIVAPSSWHKNWLESP